MRRFFQLLLLLCLPLYGFAMQGALPPAAGAALHALGNDTRLHHHHQDDGSVHYDDSDASLDHAQDHSSCAQPAVFPIARLMLPSAPPASLLARYVTRVVPEPFLEGPHRPPACAPGQTAGGSTHT